MIFKQFNFDGCLSYIIACASTRKGAIIDPSHEVQPYFDFISEQGLIIHYIIDTHTHVDHVSLSLELARKLSAKTVMNKNTPNQREIGAGVKEFFGIEKIIAENATIPVDLFLDEKDRLDIGHISLECIYTPGHTKDSMCLHANDRMFTGDTLIIGQCGRTDLPGGSSEDMYNTFFQKLFPMSNDLIIYPAHDYNGNINSSLGYEKTNNVCMKTERSLTEFVTFLEGLFPPLSADGGKLQCGLTMAGTGTPSSGEEQINTLMKSFCVSMEQYLSSPHESTLIQAKELMEKIKKGEKTFLLDVREPSELLQTGFIAGSVNISVREVAKKINELPSDMNYPIAVICESGIRSAHAAIYLRAYGYNDVKNLEFGIREWRTHGYPLAYPKND
jgi:glyoxylase-like metal-dependent hydrolase (beta-lactamase superfamily II)/rhodanese-related sulfurtransferase